MNVIERTLGAIYRRVRAGGGSQSDADHLALYSAMLVLRGGCAPESEVYADYLGWVAEHGPPDRAKLERWAAGLGVEAGIAEASLRSWHEQREGNHHGG
jgi:hypothetical protein